MNSKMHTYNLYSNNVGVNVGNYLKQLWIIHKFLGKLHPHTAYAYIVQPGYAMCDCTIDRPLMRWPLERNRVERPWVSIPETLSVKSKRRNLIWLDNFRCNIWKFFMQLMVLKLDQMKTDLRNYFAYTKLTTNGNRMLSEIPRCQSLAQNMRSVCLFTVTLWNRYPELGVLPSNSTITISIACCCSTPV